MMVGEVEGRFLEFLVRAERREARARARHVHGLFVALDGAWTARGRPRHLVRRERGDDGDRAALRRGGGARRPHRVPPRPRARARSQSSTGRSTSSSSTPTSRTTATTTKRCCRSSPTNGLILADNALRNGRVLEEDADEPMQAVQRLRAERPARRVRAAHRARRHPARHEALTRSTVSSSSERRTTSATASASVARRVVRVRDRDDAHAGRVRRADAVARVLDGGAAASARRRAVAPPRGRRPARASRARPPRTTPSRETGRRCPPRRARRRSPRGSTTTRGRAANARPGARRPRPRRRASGSDSR